MSAPVETPTHSDSDIEEDEEIVCGAQLWLYYHAAKRGNSAAVRRLLKLHDDLQYEFKEVLIEILSLLVEVLPHHIPTSWLDPLRQIYINSNRFRSHATRNPLHPSSTALSAAAVRLRAADSIRSLHEAAVRLRDDGVQIAEDPISVVQYLCKEFGVLESSRTYHLYAFLRLPYANLAAAKVLAIDKLDVVAKRDVLSYGREMFVLARMLETGAVGIAPDLKRAIALYELLLESIDYNYLVVRRLLVIACCRRSVVQIRDTALHLVRVAAQKRVSGAVDAIRRCVRELLRRGLVDVTEGIEMLRNAECWPFEFNWEKVGGLQSIVTGFSWPRELRERALGMLEEAVENDGGDFCIALGELYEKDCDFLATDLERAVQLYEKGLYPKPPPRVLGYPLPIQQGQPRDRGVAGLRRVLQADNLKAKEYALTLLEQASERWESRRSCLRCFVGNILHKGVGIPADIERAERVFRRGIESSCVSCARGLVALGRAQDFEHGSFAWARWTLEQTIAGPADSTPSLVYVHQAISVCTKHAREHHDTRSLFELLGRLVMADAEGKGRAARIHALNLLQYNVCGALALGRILEQGTDVLDKDLEVAIEVYAMSAWELGPGCNEAVGRLLRSGMLSREERIRAVELLHWIRERGNLTCAAELGRFLEEGDGSCEPDVRGALELYWYEELLTGNKFGGSLARLMQNGGPGLKRDPTEAIRLYEEGVILDEDVCAMNALADLLERTEISPDVAWASELRARVAESTSGCLSLPFDRSSRNTFILSNTNGLWTTFESYGLSHTE